MRLRAQQAWREWRQPAFARARAPRCGPAMCQQRLQARQPQHQRRRFLQPPWPPLHLPDQPEQRRRVRQGPQARHQQGWRGKRWRARLQGLPLARQCWSLQGRTAGQQQTRQQRRCRCPWCSGLPAPAGEGRGRSGAAERAAHRLRCMVLHSMLPVCLPACSPEGPPVQRCPGCYRGHYPPQHMRQARSRRRPALCCRQQ